MIADTYDLMDQLRSRQGTLMAFVTQMERMRREMESDAGHCSASESSELCLLIAQLRECLLQLRELDVQISLLCARMEMGIEIEDMPEIYGPPGFF